jgi:hypothetical protein
MKYGLTACKIGSYGNNPAKLTQRVFGKTLGYEDLDDRQIIRKNPLFQIISDHCIKDALPVILSQRLYALYHGI